MNDKELNSIIDRSEDEYQKLKDKVIEQGLEIERLNNIINEFENWLGLAMEIFNNVDVKTLELVKRKLKELRESSK